MTLSRADAFRMVLRPCAIHANDSLRADLGPYLKCIKWSFYLGLVLTVIFGWGVLNAKKVDPKTHEYSKIGLSVSVGLILTALLELYRLAPRVQQVYRVSFQGKPL